MPTDEIINPEEPNESKFPVPDFKPETIEEFYPIENSEIDGPGKNGFTNDRDCSEEAQKVQISQIYYACWPIGLKDQAQRYTRESFNFIKDSDYYKQYMECQDPTIYTNEACFCPSG